MRFERFSVRAGQAVFIARIAAGELGSSFLDTEDLLLGILHLDPGLVQKSGANLTAEEFLAIFPQWRTAAPKIKTSQDLPISPELGRALEASISLADEMGSNKVQTAHLLLALMMDPECHAGIALKKAGPDTEVIRRIAIDPEIEEPQTLDPPWYESLRSLFPNLDL
jgi:ATP-dependent Clp protease ATP-binding subunit ClpA